MNMRFILIIFFTLLTVGSTNAADLEVQPVTDGVWALVGEKQQRSPENLANNATFGVIETSDGVVLVDPGGSWKGAEQIHKAIQRLTNKSVTHVINTGGQDHRWIGNGYWQAQGVQIIASRAAVKDQKARGSMEMTMLSQLLGTKLEGTKPVYAQIVFEDRLDLETGGVKLEIIHPGHAHTPGDSFVWVPEKDVVFTGDIVYVERILGVGDQSSITTWPSAFQAIEKTGAAHVVPGHGHATTMKVARADTYDYLMNLREKIAEHIDKGGDIISSVAVDQSRFSYLEQFDSLARRNAQTAYQQMEWE
jgi:glyoxylase-like metal-dependent hydrolase (beta-lactamase superfamily II)